MIQANPAYQQPVVQALIEQQPPAPQAPVPAERLLAHQIRTFFETLPVSQYRQSRQERQPTQQTAHTQTQRVATTPAPSLIEFFTQTVAGLQLTPENEQIPVHLGATSIYINKRAP
ncbi:MAG: hypothetical protein ACRC9W_08495, partial [Plesiomonas sp.]